MIDPLYALSGFGVGLLVGMTGIGGGSLMTPVLIVIFGIHPATAVGTDLLYAAATKTGGSLVHGFARSIEWPIVRRLALGSIPASIVTLYALSLMDPNSAAASSLVTIVLCGALIMTAGILIFRNAISATWHAHIEEFDPRTTLIVTVLVGGSSGRACLNFIGRSGCDRCNGLDNALSQVAGCQHRRFGHCSCSAADLGRRSRTLDRRYG